MPSLREMGISPMRGSFHTGTNKTVCPKCSNRSHARQMPSLSVTVDPDGSAVWLCHYPQCAWKGTTNEKHNTIDFARRKPQPITNTETEWLVQRGISAATAEKYGVATVCVKFGDDNKRAIAFVSRAEPNGPILNVKYRTRDKQFSQEPGGTPVLWGMDHCSAELGDELIITEGEMDVLALAEAGFLNAVSVPNSSTGSMPWIQNCEKFLSQFSTYIIAVDGDEVGKKLRNELTQRLGPAKCRVVEWIDGCKDANDVLIKIGGNGLTEVVRAAVYCPVEGIYNAETFFEGADDFFSHGIRAGLSLGWKSLRPLYTIRRGELTVVTGYPGSGKSEFTDQMMINLGKLYDWKFGVASFENDPPEHVAKLAEKYIGKGVYAAPKMSGAEFDAAKHWINEHFTWILKDMDKGLPTLEWVLERMLVLHRQKGVDGFVIDPWNQMGQDRKDMSETDFAGYLLSRLRQFVRKTQTHIWLVAHPAKMMRLKDGSMPIPGLQDIAGSKNFHAMTDNGIVIHRSMSELDASDIFVKKIRSRATGKVGQITLNWHPTTGRYFEDYADERLDKTVNGAELGYELEKELE